jgi:predicted amidophosphoribosyltransferase
MVCLGCSRSASARLCDICRRQLRRAPPRLLPGGIPILAAFEHEAVARRLVHLLKYQAVTEVADLMASVLSPQLPPFPLVPVPRAMTRRIKYGVDPALELARAFAKRTGADVVRALSGPIHTRGRAGHNRARPVPEYRRRNPAPEMTILVDDVVTSGATALAATRALGSERVRLVVAANSASGVSSLRDRVTSQTTRNH